MKKSFTVTVEGMFLYTVMIVTIVTLSAKHIIGFVQPFVTNVTTIGSSAITFAFILVVVSVLYSWGQSTFSRKEKKAQNFQGQNSNTNQR